MVNDIVPKVVEMFNPLFSKVSPDLIRRSGMYADEVEKLFDVKWKSVSKRLKKDGLSSDSLAVSNAKGDLFKQCLHVISNKHKGQVSPYEVNALNQVLGRFNSKFDLDDPSVYLIVSSIVDMTLNNVRLQIENANRDALMIQTLDNGVTTMSVNPTFKGSLEFSKEIINAVEKLNRIINGDKVTVNIDSKAIPFDSLFGDADIIEVDDD